MLVESHHKLGRLQRTPASRVLICLDDGTPICLCVEIQPGHVRCFRVGDEDFNQQLHMAGIEATVMVTKFDPSPDKGPKEKRVLRG